jgi:hypothetical protein
MTQEIDVPKEISSSLGDGEKVLFREKGTRWAPGGEEWHPNEIFVTNSLCEECDFSLHLYH